MKPTDRTAATAALWDPRAIDDCVWQQINVDLDTLGSDIAGRDWTDGFKRRGGLADNRAYAVDVWSQVYTVEDFQRKEARTEFVPVEIAGRAGLQYRPAADRTGDQSSVIFPARHGSLSVEVLRLDPRSPIAPADRVMMPAALVVPLLPG